MIGLKVVSNLILKN